MHEVRQADPADVPAIMQARSLDSVWGPADARTGAYLEGRHHPGFALEPRALFVSRVGEAVVGYIAGHRTRRYGCDGEVQYLWVAPEHRGTSIATDLLSRLAEWFVAEGVARVCVDVVPDNARAHAFYARHGAVELNPSWLVWEDIGSVIQGE